MHQPYPLATAVETQEAPSTIAPVEPALMSELLTNVDERGQVTVRCRYTSELGDLIRIWQSTFLICYHTGHRSELLHAEGITYAPYWMRVPENASMEFTLVFAPLPRECTVFDLIEVIPQPGGFHVSGIARNSRDLYHVDI